MDDQIPGITIRAMVAADADAAAGLVRRVFRRHVAPLYTTDGIGEFEAYASAEGFKARLGVRHSGFVAEDRSGQIVGLAEVRGVSHLSLLFVSNHLQRRGIGAALVMHAVDLCRLGSPTCAAITVNASPNAIQAYERFGFFPTGPEQERNGIRFVPMKLAISALGGT